MHIRTTSAALALALWSCGGPTTEDAPSVDAPSAPAPAAESAVEKLVAWSALDQLSADEGILLTLDEDTVFRIEDRAVAERVVVRMPDGTEFPLLLASPNMPMPMRVQGVGVCARSGQPPPCANVCEPICVVHAGARVCNAVCPCTNRWGSPNGCLRVKEPARCVRPRAVPPLDPGDPAPPEGQGGVGGVGPGGSGSGAGGPADPRDPGVGGGGEPPTGDEGGPGAPGGPSSPADPPPGAEGGSGSGSGGGYGGGSGGGSSGGSGGGRGGSSGGSGGSSGSSGGSSSGGGGSSSGGGGSSSGGGRGGGGSGGGFH